jgi:hypothetical protein
MTDDEAWGRVVEARERGVSAAVAELIGACTCREPRDRLRAADVAAAAGSLAFQRLSRGARATLRDWLAPIKPKDEEGSALDDLMGLCLVPVAAQDDGGRTFTVSQMMPIAQPVLPGQLGDVRSIALRTMRDPRAARTSAPIEIQSYEPEPLTTGQRLARASRWAAAALVVATAATFTAWKSGVGLRASATAASQAAETSFAPVVPAAPERRRVAPAAVAADADQPQEMHFKRADRTPPSGAPAPGRPSRHNKHYGLHPPGPRSAPVAATADSVPRGWLRVGGSGLFGGKIAVDGDDIGFAPLERELAVGTHNITVVSPTSGQTLLRQTVRIGGHHTHSKALSLLR